MAAGTPVDAFGIGTSLAVSEDVPALDMVYKMQLYAGRPRRKVSPGKETWPGAKQIFRERGTDGKLAADLVALAEEELPGQPLLREIMRDGRRIAELPPLHSSREYFLAQLADLPSALRKLDDGGGAHYPVHISDRVRALARMADAAIADINTRPVV